MRKHRSAGDPDPGLARTPRKSGGSGTLPVPIGQNQIHMLRWVLIFLVVAIVAAIFGFTGIAAGAAEIAKIIFYLFLVLLVLEKSGVSWIDGPQARAPAVGVSRAGAGLGPVVRSLAADGVTAGVHRRRSQSNVPQARQKGASPAWSLAPHTPHVVPAGAALRAWRAISTISMPVGMAMMA